MDATAETLAVGLVQMRMTKDGDDNLARAREGVRDCADRGAQLVVLPVS